MTSDVLLDSEDPLQVYVREVSRVPPLDAIEEAACLEHLRAADERADDARRRLLEAHLHLVITVAGRYRNDRVHILDLIEQGNKGLIHALDSLGECTEGSAPFWSYAEPFVERSIAEVANDLEKPTH